MNWIMRNEFVIAYEKANLILSKLNLNSCRHEMMRTADIIDAVEKELGLDIKFTTLDFKKFNKERYRKPFNIESFGAAMCVSSEEKQAIIVLNEKETPEMQRFSLVHELGHLMIQDLTEFSGYRVSTHIDMDITSIPNELLDKQGFEFLVEEQQANIFALLVLIPYELLKNAIKEHDSVEGIAKAFGVERNAIFSRMELERPLTTGGANG